MIFRPKQERALVTSPLTIDNTVIGEVEHTKFLGVYVDQHLAWKHILTSSRRKKQKECFIKQGFM